VAIVARMPLNLREQTRPLRDWREARAGELPNAISTPNSTACRSGSRWAPPGTKIWERYLTRYPAGEKTRILREWLPDSSDIKPAGSSAGWK